MMINYCDLSPDIIKKSFPELKSRVDEETAKSDEFLPNVVFGLIFNSLTVSLLMQDDYSENELLIRIFDMYEDLSSNGDIETRNLVQVSLLEYLWERKTTYDRAMELMGKHTRDLWEYIYDYINVPKEDL